MEFQKRLDYGFNGYQVPAIPRSSRSARRRSAFGSRCKEGHLQAFDLLATVAGDLFHPAISWDDSTVKEEPAIVKKEWPEIEPLFETLHSEGRLSQLTPPVMSSDSSERITDESTIRMERLACKIDLGSNCHKTSKVNCNLDWEDRVRKEDDSDSGAGMGISNLEDMCINQKALALEGSNNGCKAPLCRDSSNPANQEDVKVVGRDDDENTSGCTHPIDPIKPSFRPSTFNGNRKVRKILPSRYWKVAPKRRDETFSNDRYLKPVYRNKRNPYKFQRSQMNIPFKKRKFFDCNSVSDSDGTVNIDGHSNSFEKRAKTDAYASGAAASATGHRKLFQSRRDSHGTRKLMEKMSLFLSCFDLSYLCLFSVKLKIRSFRVPEFFIEIPESATIGSLKRTVMEAVTAFLGSGLRVGVLLQGKKVRDDSKTLFQTGISHDNQLDSLGFTLEPTPQASTQFCHGSSPHKLLGDSTMPLTRYAPAEPEMVNLGTLVESDRESAPSPVDALIEKSQKDCKALVSLDALAVVRPHQKLKQSEVVQRRIRRPFSVPEVEALVETVEKLGTGRWRDVKVCAFDNAKHRTYVDLKDKWKTLVHTARIAPQQRRGEPVPQELLDRVLAAQSYWSQHQPKLLKLKPDPCLLL